MQTQRYLTDYLLADCSDIIYSPLKEYSINSELYQWYDLKELPEVEIELLVVDGPPGFIQKNSCYPVLPLLCGFLAKSCIIIMDDAARKDEKEIISLWLHEYPEFQFEYVDNEHGCAILTR